jgi:tagaturonate reductase
MKRLSFKTLQDQGVDYHALRNLPERVLQFGTGVLLRALPDYFIDQANKKGIFNGERY